LCPVSQGAIVATVQDESSRPHVRGSAPISATSHRNPLKFC
jgi:hypothetical protein